MFMSFPVKSNPEAGWEGERSTRHEAGRHFASEVLNLLSPMLMHLLSQFLVEKMQLGEFKGSKQTRSKQTRSKQ